jgi:cyclohexanone monooxygenase
VKSHLYSYSFDLNSNWSRLWSGQREILEYFEQCAQRHELRPNLKLHTEIVSAHWDPDSTSWQLTTATGELYTFDVVVSAVGLFTQPVLPDLVEEEKFTGTLMHTACWDHSVDLRDARVAVLGTGSTASQLIPEVAREAKKVYSVLGSLGRPARCAGSRPALHRPGEVALRPCPVRQEDISNQAVAAQRVEHLGDRERQ